MGIGPYNGMLRDRLGGKLGVRAQSAVENVGAIIDRPRAHTVRPYIHDLGIPANGNLKLLWEYYRAGRGALSFFCKKVLTNQV